MSFVTIPYLYCNYWSWEETQIELLSQAVRRISFHLCSSSWKRRRSFICSYWHHGTLRTHQKLQFFAAFWPKTALFLRLLLETFIFFLTHQKHLRVDLPCVSLLHSLMTILQFCNGFLSPTSPLGSTISRNLINCFRVQKSALDVLAALSEKKGEFIFAFLSKTISAGIWLLHLSELVLWVCFLCFRVWHSHRKSIWCPPGIPAESKHQPYCEYKTRERSRSISVPQWGVILIKGLTAVVSLHILY